MKEGGARDEYTFFVSGTISLDESSVTAHARGNVALNDHLCLQFPRERGLVVSLEEGEFRAEVPIPCSEVTGSSVQSTSYSASWRGIYNKTSLEVAWSETSSRLWGSLDYRGCLRREHDKSTGTSWLELSGAFTWSAQPSVRGTFELRLDDSSAFSDHSLWTDMPCSFRSCACLRFDGGRQEGGSSLEASADAFCRPMLGRKNQRCRHCGHVALYHRKVKGGALRSFDPLQQKHLEPRERTPCEWHEGCPCVEYIRDETRPTSCLQCGHGNIWHKEPSGRPSLYFLLHGEQVDDGHVTMGPGGGQQGLEGGEGNATTSSSWKRPINTKEWNQRNHAVKEEAKHLLEDRLPQLLEEVVAASGNLATELRKERERRREAPSAAAAAIIAAATSEKARCTRAFVDTCNKLLRVAVHRERLGQEQPPSVPPPGANGGAMTGPEAERWRRDDAKARFNAVAEADASAEKIYRAVLRAQETVFGSGAGTGEQKGMEESQGETEGGLKSGDKSSQTKPMQIDKGTKRMRRRRGHATWNYTAQSVPALSQFARLRRRQGRHAEAIALLEDGLRMRCAVLGVDERGEAINNNNRPNAEETALLSSSFAEVGLALVRNRAATRKDVLWTDSLPLS